MALSAEVKLTDLRHPFFLSHERDWQLWRDVYEGGSNFIDRYLKQFSKREDSSDFALRKEVTYCPEFAASAVDDVKNSIYQRMIDITRVGGTPSYQSAVIGADDGVDLLGSSMNYFIGQKILPELLTMKRVGVYVDMPQIELPVNMFEARGLRPYIYFYKAEEICNWTFDQGPNKNEYRQVILRETYDLINPKFNLPYGSAERYRHMFLDEEGYCCCSFYNLDGDPIDEFGRATRGHVRLPIRRIPFYCFSLPHSLLKAVGRYQIALLNIASSDINYVLRANFPLYTEQQDFRATSPHLRGPDIDDDGSSNGTASNNQKEIAVGVATGRAYGKDLERPDFIHPSPEPMLASMKKQDQLKQEIRLLINLALTNMTPTKQQSVGSKEMDNQGLEAGLSYIGLELEKGERKIAEYWAMYENATVATVQYPIRYSLKSDEERRADAKQYKELLPTIPSPTLQRQLAKQIARSLVGYKVSREDMEKIESEIDKAPFIAVDPEIIQKDVEIGILDRENAARSRLYPEDAVNKANKEHAERLARIQESQATQDATGARGNPDGSGDPKKDATDEKKESRDNTEKGDNKSRVRGDGK